MRTFTPEFKAFIIIEYRHGFKMQDFYAVYKISTRTVKKILNKAGVVTRYCRLKGKKWFTYADHIQALKQAGQMFNEWIEYKKKYGIFDLDAVCKGEEPP